MTDIANTEAPISNENTPQSLKPYVEPLREENKKVPNKVMEMIAHFKQYFKIPKSQKVDLEIPKNSFADKFDSIDLEQKSEMAQMDESKRLITENVYDCWETEPINSGTVKLKIDYQKPTSEVLDALKVVDESGIKFSVSDYVPEYDKNTHYSRVEYEIPLANLKIPDRLEFGYVRNIDSVVRKLEFFESLNVPPAVIKDSLDHLAFTSQFYLVDSIQKIKSRDSSAPFPDIPPRDSNEEFQKLQDEDHLLRYENFVLPKSYPEFDPNKPSTLIKHVKESILKYIDEHPDDDFSEIRENLNDTDCGESESHETTLDQAPAIYHDTIIDSRFKNGGYLDGDIIVGDLITNYAERDIDASSAALLLTKLRYALGNNNDKNYYTPPNMTNMFYFHIPVVTNEIYEADKKLSSPERNEYRANSKFYIDVYTCDSLTRLNPVTVTNRLNNYGQGEGRWILTTIDPSTNTFERVNIKPKESWKVTSKKPRINIPWVPVYRENE